MKRIFITTIFCFAGIFSFAQKQETTKDYKQSLVSYEDFKNLTSEVEKHRAERLVDFDTFLRMSQDENVVILDTRSTFRYNLKHIKGAIHLSFTDFTQQSLNELIPDPSTKILIYCNNNFEGDQLNFASKIAIPNKNKETHESATKTTMLALNVPTYINLYGYGYRNVYELNELVNINDQRLKLEGIDDK